MLPFVLQLGIHSHVCWDAISSRVNQFRFLCDSRTASPPQLRLRLLSRITPPGMSFSSFRATSLRISEHFLRVVPATSYKAPTLLAPLLAPARPPHSVLLGISNKVHIRWLLLPNHKRHFSIQKQDNDSPADVCWFGMRSHPMSCMQFVTQGLHHYPNSDRGCSPESLLQRYPFLLFGQSLSVFLAFLRVVRATSYKAPTMLALLLPPAPPAPPSAFGYF